MKILSIEEYNKLWSELGECVKKIEKVPCYFEYLQREVYFRDYLDLFLGKEKETFERQLINGKETVYIKGLMEQDRSTKKRTCKSKNGEIRLVVDHAYPYKDLLGVDRKVKYVLIGEAAPDGGKYIYKDAKSAYMTAPLRATGIDPDKIESFKRLEKFAEKGFLHLDLFPFAFDFNKYGGLRKELSEDTILISSYFKSVEDQVNKFESLGILDSCWDYCFVAPKLTSKALIDQVNKTIDKSFVGRSIDSDHDIKDGDDFKGSEDYVSRTKLPGSNLQHLPRIAKLTVIMGGTGPNHELVKRALPIK